MKDNKRRKEATARYTLHTLHTPDGLSEGHVKDTWKDNERTE